MRLKFALFVAAATTLAACQHYELPTNPNENPSTFTEISTTDVGETGAAEISAYDPLTKKLFTVTNAGATTQIDVHDFSNPAALVRIASIDITPYGSNVNSVSVSNGKVAAAVEGATKTDNGSICVFKTSDYSFVKKIAVGALPDMVTYTHDGNYILSANEGEPADDYSVDPKGTVSIISVKDNYAVTTIDFSAFASKQADLMAKGFRVFGPAANFLTNIEPEYITVSADSKTAWITLQENNAIAKLDIRSKKLTDIFPLGFKDYNVSANAIDPSDKDNTITLRNVPVKGMYQPDGIAVYDNGGVPLLFTANEGDVREWTAYAENKRLKDIVLDPTAFPTGATLRTDANLGRLNITSTLGDTDNDGDYDALYSFGARSFSVWNGNNGKLVFDSENQLERQAIAAGLYDDNRSDDKGVEPESVILGYVGRKAVAFVGMERADAVAIYDVTNPQKPVFLKLLQTGDAPEGLLFIPAQDSPTRKSLLVVSSEGDGTIKVYSAQ